MSRLRTIIIDADLTALDVLSGTIWLSAIAAYWIITP
jgi:hypothetical protein